MARSLREDVKVFFFIPEDVIRGISMCLDGFWSAVRLRLCRHCSPS